MQKQRTRGNLQNNGLVYVDYERLKTHMVDLGLCEIDFANFVGIMPRTLARIRKRLGIRISTLKVIARKLALNPSSLLARVEPTVNFTANSRNGASEWEVAETVTDWFQSSNGLEFRICRMGHCYLPDTWGRGKCYNLNRLSTKDQGKLREQLIRHPRICRRFRGHRQIPLNVAVYPEEKAQLWWVVDEWVPGTTLARALRVGPYPEGRLASLMAEIAEGLRVLHDAVVIRRELAPHNILLREVDGSAVLTDFELGKLLDGSRTVSHPDWPDDPYRAPEVGSPNVDGRADLYSWGRILVHAASGKLPKPGEEQEVLDGLGLPAKIARMASRCVALACSDRPSSIDDVVKAIQGWE